MEDKITRVVQAAIKKEKKEILEIMKNDGSSSSMLHRAPHQRRELSKTLSINDKSYQASLEKGTREEHANITPINDVSKQTMKACPLQKFKIPHLES